jgi:glycosyltransferase involved in cell wall biosynthesis
MWYCHQLGSREHYAIPRALHAAGKLALLQTDSWVPPRWSGLLAALKQRSLGLRYHPDLASARVKAFTLGRLTFDLKARLAHREAWETILRRNAWFQKRARPNLAATGAGDVVFSYSYTARSLFVAAQSSGAACVLGQIDPGPGEFRWLRQALGKDAPLAEPPPQYWKEWRMEVSLADAIVVNSAWSRQLLLEEGVSPEKIVVVPLSYEPAAAAAPKGYPARFTAERPLRALFLGQVIARKGAGPLFEAIAQLAGEPVTFEIAGPAEVPVPDLPNLRYHGAVDRLTAERLYEEADVFLLPTWSDGFALTQLEAAAHRLPLIVSKNCGQVVEPEKNGLVLEEISAAAIANALRRCLAEPGLLARFSAAGLDWEPFSLAALGGNLRVVEELALENAARRAKV